MLPALLAAVLLVGGCAGDPESSPAPRTAPGSPTAEESPDSSRSQGSGREKQGKGGTRGGRAASSSPDTDGGKVAPALPLARGNGADDHLLTAETLPEVGDDPWTERSTGAEGSRLVGACHRATLVDIGSLHAVFRVFTGAEGSGLRARQAVARYADPKSAWRAHQVLRAWRADCEEHLPDPSEVGPMEKVTLDAGTGARYAVTFGPEKDPDDRALGFLRRGRWLAVVEIRATEGDVPAAWTRRAVRRIAATW